MQNKSLNSYENAFYISLIYFILAMIWIIWSDYFVSLLTEDADGITMLQTYKGVFFVFVTTAILFFLTYRFFHAMKLQYNKNIEYFTKQQELRASLEDSYSELSKYDMLLNMIIKSSPDAIYAKDLEGKYILFNDAAAKMVNIDAQNILDKGDEVIFTSENAEKIKIEDKKIIKNAEVIKKEEKHIFAGGVEKIFSTTKGALINKQNEVFGLFGVSRDITENREHERFLIETKDNFYKLSHLDNVTSLPNRLYLSEFLINKCSQKSSFCLLLLDLDEFKVVNDSYGHRFGDKLLAEISKILKKVFASTSFIARMGGDEFGIVVDLNDKKEIEILMQKLHNELNNPFVIDLIDVYITASSGICIYPDDAKTMLEMYQAADAAMYNAKKRTQNSYSFYDLQFKKNAISYTETVTNLKQAIEKEEFELYFQPQNNTLTGTIVGVEVLLRWTHNGEMIPPDLFIPVAEKSGLIVEIGNFVLKNSFKIVKRWHELGILKGRVAINISARQLTHLDLISTLKKMLQESGCKASWIELEITESSVLENPELVIDLLQKIKELGFYISMDDFGTGYSSLSYLKNLPIDKLKIDRSFIMNIKDQPKNQIIVKTTIFLGKELGIHVLAEGVETEDEHSFLKENKIDSIQGYYYSKPLPLNKIELLLQA